MLQQPPLLAALPGAVVDMTTDFTPLLMGLVVGVCLGVLAVALLIGLYDRGWLAQPRQPATEPSA